MFKDASDNSKELKKELKDLPDEIVDKDGTDDLPGEIGLDDKNEEQYDNNSPSNKQKDIREDDKPQDKKGGSYRDVKRTSDGNTHEVHHMPADSVSKLERDDGPAIKMEKADHHKTASFGSTKEAREYRDIQKGLIEEGKFREALQMDIDDIHEKFGDKYDDAIAEMMEYVDKLEQEGKL